MWDSHPEQIGNTYFKCVSIALEVNYAKMGQ